MAVNITEAELAAALRVGSSVEETAEVTRLLAYCTEAISKHLGTAYSDNSRFRCERGGNPPCRLSIRPTLRSPGHRIREGPGELWSGSDIASLSRSPRRLDGRGKSLMPIDRRITVQIRGEDQRDRYGELVPGAINYFPVWAGRFDKTLEDISEIGGERSQIRRAWRVRWFSDLAGITDLERVAVEDGGIEFDVENLVEETGKDGRTRRRWLMIEGVYST